MLSALPQASEGEAEHGPGEWATSVRYRSLTGVDRMARPTDRDVRRQDNAELRIE